MAPHSRTLARKSHGRRSLVGCSPWGHYESDATEQLHFQFSLSRNGEGNGNPLQCSCLENPRDGRAWWAAVYGSHRVGHDWSDLAAAAAAGITLKNICDSLWIGVHRGRLVGWLLVRLPSCGCLFATRWTAAYQASRSLTISRGLLKLMSIGSNDLILCLTLLLPSVFPSIRSFPWVDSSHQVATVLELQPQHEHPGLVSLGWTGWVSLQSKGLSGVSSNTTVQKHQFFGAQLSLWSDSHIRIWLLERPWFWLYGRWLAKWCLCSLRHWFVSSFLSKKQASFNFMAEVTIRSDFRTRGEIYHCFYLFPFCLPWNGVILAFLILSFKPEFSFSSFTFIKRLFHSSSFSALNLEWCHLHLWGCWYFSLRSWL